MLPSPGKDVACDCEKRGENHREIQNICGSSLSGKEKVVRRKL